MVGLGQFGEQPFHFVLFQWHVDLDSGVAGYGGGNSSAHGFEIDGLLFTSQLFEDFVEQVLDLRGVYAGRGEFDRNAAGSEGLGLKTVAGQLFGNLSKNSLLRRRQVDDERHQQTLAFDPLDCALAHDAFEEHALVSDVLIDDPEAIFVDGQNKSVSNLA